MSDAPAGHRVLVVEDDPETAEDVRALLTSRGDSVRVAATAAEALAALEEETFCYFVVDQQLPAAAFDAPMLGGGERVLRASRHKDERRKGAFHVTPVLVLTSYSGHEDFVSKMYDLGASGFMSKPLRGNFERLLDKIRVALERAGRAAHADCAAHGAGAPRLDAAGQARPGGIASQLGVTSFGALAMKVVDGHTLRIANGRKHVTVTYLDLGLATKTRVPTREWELLVDVCAGHGTFRWKKFGTFHNARQRIYILRKKLKAAFGIDDDPFHAFRATDGWRARFRASSEIAGDDG
jgi:CheY-like chemotaxis protein